jgi:hypothetical protein
VLPGTFKFVLVPGTPRTDRLSIGFLTGDRDLNAFTVFNKLNEKPKRELMSSFGVWLAGKDKPAKRFHGFPNDKEYSMCFVFKVKENRLGHRFYGFVCNPQPNQNPRFQLCVLCVHTTKSEWETDRTKPAIAKKMSLNESAKEAIAVEYPDKIDQKKGQVLPWKT